MSEIILYCHLLAWYRIERYNDFSVFNSFDGLASDEEIREAGAQAGIIWKKSRRLN